MHSLVSSKKASLSWQNKPRLSTSCQKEGTVGGLLRDYYYYLSKEGAALWTLVSGSCLAKYLKAPSFLMQELHTIIDWLFNPMALWTDCCVQINRDENVTIYVVHRNLTY